MAKQRVRARVADRRNVSKKTGVVVGGDVHEVRLAVAAKVDGQIHV
jgi:hypothetical protein